VLLGSLTVNMKEANIYGLFTGYNFSKKDSYVKIFIRMFFLALAANSWMANDKNKLLTLRRETKILRGLQL